jgi:hypothetical protein
MADTSDPSYRRGHDTASRLQGEDPVVVQVAALFVAAGLLTTAGVRKALDGAQAGLTETPAPTGKPREVNCTGARIERRESPDTVGRYNALGWRLGFSPWPRADAEG